jgi:hypothetical protein
MDVHMASTFHCSLSFFRSGPRIAAASLALHEELGRYAQVRPRFDIPGIVFVKLNRDIVGVRRLERDARRRFGDKEYP